MTSAQSAVPQGSPDHVEVENVNQFVDILSAWHANRVAVLEHMLSIPTGTEMELSDGTKKILEGDFLDGFRAGIGLSLMQLGTLPFAELPDPAANDAKVV